MEDMDSFGHWLAGFVDGEGAFVIARVGSRVGKYGNPHGKTWPNARFEITLRADDLGVLETIRETLGIGKIVAHSAASLARPNTKPSARYAVWRIADCLLVCEWFERYPLRGKKRHQFAIWKQAVREIAKGGMRDDALIDRYRAELAAARVYDQTFLDGWTPDPILPKLTHRADYGEAPLCLCGCGQPTKPRASQLGIPHPDNQAYRRFLAGHNRRPHASFQ